VNPVVVFNLLINITKIMCFSFTFETFKDSLIETYNVVDNNKLCRVTRVVYEIKLFVYYLKFYSQEILGF
jgi:hypothetical protein